MRKKLLPFAAIATILFFGACSNEDQIPDLNPDTKQTLSLTASMPEGEPTTRVNLNQEGKNIELTWEVGDEIVFAYVQGALKATQTVTVDRISNAGKVAHFEIPIPEGAQNGPFTLYGVYGGNGIDFTGTNPRAILPLNAGSAGTLGLVQSRKDVMLYFEKEMNTANPEASVNFNHIGSLFAISFNGITQNVLDFLTTNIVSEVRLVGVESAENDESWAFNNVETIADLRGFDLVTKEFEDITKVGNYYSFSTAGSTLSIGATTTLWGWYPVLPNKVFPALELELTALDGAVVLTSGNTKPVKAEAPTAGKTYHFYATSQL